MTQMAEAEARLRRMILNMEIGPGERLTERLLETQLGASRTSVRAALFRLQSDGLIARDGRSWIVPPIDLEELAELFVYRELLEVGALRVAAQRGESVPINEVEHLLDAVVEQEEQEALGKAGDRFHLWIASLSRSAFVVRGVADALTRLRRARWLEADADHHGWAEHRAIVVAVRDGTMYRAETLLTTHLRETRDRLLAALSAQRRSLRARGAVIKAR